MVGSLAAASAFVPKARSYAWARPARQERRAAAFPARQDSRIARSAGPVRCEQTAEAELTFLSAGPPA